MGKFDSLLPLNERLLHICKRKTQGNLVSSFLRSSLNKAKNFTAEELLDFNQSRNLLDFTDLVLFDFLNLVTYSVNK